MSNKGAEPCNLPQRGQLRPSTALKTQRTNYRGSEVEEEKIKKRLQRVHTIRRKGKGKEMGRFVHPVSVQP